MARRLRVRVRVLVRRCNVEDARAPLRRRRAARALARAFPAQFAEIGEEVAPVVARSNPRWEEQQECRRRTALQLVEKKKEGESIR